MLLGAWVGNAEASTMPAPAGFGASANVDNSVTGSWSAVAGATKYDMQASLDADFASVFDTYTVNAPSTSAMTAVLTPGTWFFRARGKVVGQNAFTGAWSNAASITIASEDLLPTPPADTVAPVLSLPENMTVEATGPSGAVVMYTVTATDDVTASPIVSCTPASGSAFALGTTEVDCTATDEAGNVASGSFSITVRDTTPPVLSAVPSVVNVIVGAPKSVLDTPAAADLVDMNPAVTNNAPDTFPLGDTTVIWTATDASGNASTESVTVHATYRFGGFLQPIPTPIASFKAGSTIPVKFKLYDYNGNAISNAIAIVNAGAVSGAAKYDATAQQYVYTLSTKGMSVGPLTIKALLSDLSSYAVSVTLK